MYTSFYLTIHIWGNEFKGNYLGFRFVQVKGIEDWQSANRNCYEDSSSWNVPKHADSLEYWNDIVGTKLREGSEF